MTPDRATVPTMQMLLQISWGWLHLDPGHKQRSFTDTIGKNLKKMDSVPFPEQDYQFTRVPYGFRNSISAFIGAVQSVLGADTSEYVLHYVDNSS